jgi:hypothetical protein
MKGLMAMMMTVAELIKELKEFEDKEQEILVFYTDIEEDCYDDSIYSCNWDAVWSALTESVDSFRKESQ